MKIRNGFVSNSSSSSFVLKVKNLTVKDIALMMIERRNEDNYGGYIDWKADKLLERLRNISIDQNLPFTFHTCNYETFIKKLDDYIFIDTCHNHDFYNLVYNYKAKDINQEIIIKILGYKSGDLYYSDINGCDGLDLENHFKFYNIDELEKMQKEKNNENS